MTSPGERRPPEFEIVRRGPALEPPPSPPVAPRPIAPPDEPPAPTPPRRPTGVSILSVLAVAQGAMTLVGLLAFVAFAGLLGGGDDAAFFGAILLFFAVLGLPFAGAGLVVGWGLWNGRKWAWIGAIALCGLLTLSSLGGVASAMLTMGAGPAGADGAGPLVAFQAVWALAPIAALVYLSQPGVRAYFDEASTLAASARAASPTVPRTETGVRIALLFACAAGLILGGVAASYSARSLAGEADGASLAADALVGYVAAALLAGGAIAGMRFATQKEQRSPAAPVGVGIGAGVLVALLLVSGAQSAATMPLLDGEATGDDGVGLLMTVLGLAAFAALAVAIWRADDATVAFARWGGAAALALAIAALGLAAFVSTNAGELQTQAAARERHETSGFGAALLALAIVVAVAWTRRRNS